jgi:putative spermidine/putrescine transport system substrate-binding protein
MNTNRRPRSGRAVLAISLLSALSLTVAACGSGSGDSGSTSAKPQLTFVNYGGDGMTAAKAGWLDPYTQKTGVTFKTDQPSDQAKIKAMVESGRTSWDVVDIDAAAAGDQCGKLYEKRPAGFDTSQLMTDEITDDCMIPIINQTVGLVYNKKLYGDKPPTSITDFFNPAFPGQRITFNYWTGSAEPLALAAGIPANKVYPIDWGKLKSAVDSLGKTITFQSTLDLQAQAEESGNFGMCLCYLGRSATAAQNGADIGVVWDKVWVGWDGLYVVKGTHDSAAAWAFVQNIATSEGQNGYYSHVPYTPTTTGTAPAVPAAYKPFMLSFNQNKVTETSHFDAKYWAEQGSKAADQWTSLTSG